MLINKQNSVGFGGLRPPNPQYIPWGPSPPTPPRSRKCLSLFLLTVCGEQQNLRQQPAVVLWSLLKDKYTYKYTYFLSYGPMFITP